MRPGKLDQRIGIYNIAETDDGLGGSTTAEVLIDSVWSEVRPLSVREREEFNRVNAEASYVFVIRNRQDLLEKYFIRWDGVDYNIQGLKQKSKRHLYLEIIAERGVAQ